MTETTARLRSEGLRMTPQRRAVIEALVGDTSHPTAEVVAERVQRVMPGVSLSTVYKALHELADRGLILRIDLATGMHFDPNEVPHPHLVCRDCNAVIDVEIPGDHTATLVQTARECGYDADSVSIEFYGSCPACR